MPLSTAFYTNEKAPAPAMFQQLDDQAKLLNQPPPVPDLFKRPITPAVAQGPSFAPQVDTPQQQAPPTGGGGNQAGGGGTAAQMAQAMLLYQMLQGGGAGGFLGRLGVQPGSGFGRRLGQQGNAYAGLQDPSIAALFQKDSYFKPAMNTARQMGQGEGYRQLYGVGGGRGGRMGDDRAPLMGLTPDAYQNAITFLQTLLGLQV